MVATRKKSYNSNKEDKHLKSKEKPSSSTDAPQDEQAQALKLAKGDLFAIRMIQVDFIIEMKHFFFSAKVKRGPKPKANIQDPSTSTEAPQDEQAPDVQSQADNDNTAISSSLVTLLD